MATIAVLLGLPVAGLAQGNSEISNTKEPIIIAHVTEAGVSDSVAGAGALAVTNAAMLPVQPVQPVQPQKSLQRIENANMVPIRKWQALVVAQHSAALFDAWTTRKAITSGNGYERDPLLKPFAQSAAIYPATQAVPVALDFLSYRMMRSDNRYLRRTWWLPQAVSIVGSVWCGSRNLRVASLKH